MITKPAFDKLTAMGIDLYQLKEQPQTDSYLAIDADATLNDQFFENVLAAINLTKAEVSISHSAIDLGSILWSFNNETSITIDASRLVTPPLAQFKDSPQLKRQLWHQLSSQQF